MSPKLSVTPGANNCEGKERTNCNSEVGGWVGGRVVLKMLKEEVKDWRNEKMMQRKCEWVQEKMKIRQTNESNGESHHL